jgi:PHD/YefM family antitoxin component YafN of YafNO toxin-antitoxin module
LIENKLTTNAKSYTVKYLDLRDLEKRAILDNRVPVLQFDLGGKQFVILTEDDFLEMSMHEEQT